MNDQNGLGRYIAESRNKLHLTQKEAAERVNRAESTIANWETGHQKVPPEMFPALAQALGMSLVKLYELAGMLAELPGSEIIKLLDGLPQEEIDRVERMLRAYLEKT